MNEDAEQNLGGVAELSPRPAHDKRVISPLRRLLMDSTADSLLAYLHQMDIHYVLRREQNGHYSLKIMRDGMLKYESASGSSPKSAMADAIAMFLVGEQKDFHEYIKKVA